MPLIHPSMPSRSPNTGLIMLACIYLCVVVHLSLFPYSNWRNIGIGPLEFLSGPWIPVHQRILWGDLTVNLLGYLPLGFLMLLGVNRRPTTLDQLAVVVACAGLSLSLEAIQTYLPTRVPSKMDLAANTLGALLGVVLATAASAHLRLGGWLSNTLGRWLTDRAWLGMTLLALWLISILPPQNPTFSTGFWIGNLVSLPADQAAGAPFGMNEAWMIRIEAMAPNLINYAYLACAWLLGLAQTQPGAPRVRLLFILIAMTILVRQLDLWLGQPLGNWAYASRLWFLQNQLALGAAIAVAIALSMLRAKPYQMARLALLHLLVGWLISALLPGVYDPAIGSAASAPMQAFRNIQEAGRWLSELWPVLALTVLGFLSLPDRRFKR